MWKPDLHPRDEYGRFQLKGASGRFDRLAARVEAQGMAHTIEQYRQAGRELADLPGLHVPEAAGPLARRRAAKAQLPRAFMMNLELHTDGMWRKPGAMSAAYDSEGLRLPLAAVEGWTRVGDHPDRREVSGRPVRMNDVGSNDSPLSGGVWHRPGDYLPGRVPRLVNDFGAPIGGLEPEPARTRKFRERHGALVRAEMRAEAFGTHRAAPHATRDEPATTLASAEVQGAFMISPTNPVGRRRTARKKRDRQQNVTWVQRLNARMEGR